MSTPVIDPNCADFTKKVGNVVLWLGVETVNWSLAQFSQASAFAHGLGVDTLCVKCQDGGTVWYASQGGLAAVKQAVESHGCGFLPYAYLYGDKFGDLSGELAGLKTLMSLNGVVQADMEAEWNGQTGWAATMNSAMLPVPGLLSISTWADPANQNWLGVIAALRPCVNSWTPQEYDTSLVNSESQFPSGLCMAPGLNLPEAWPGPNDPVAAAKTAKSRGHETVFLWEYQLAQQNPTTVKDIVAVMKPAVATPPPPPPPPVDPLQAELDAANAEITTLKAQVATLQQQIATQTTQIAALQLHVSQDANAVAAIAALKTALG